MGYDDRPVPRGTSGRWEVLITEPERERAAVPPTANEVQRQHRVLREMPESLLAEIPLLVEGAALERRHEYIDLHDPARAAFRAEGSEEVRPGQHVVARDQVSEEAWRELCDACDRSLRRTALRRAG